MRLLIINPNTNAATNARIRAIAAPLVTPPDAIEVESAASSVALIETVEDSVATIPAVVAMVEDRHRDVDAIIIAAFSDPGLAEAQRIADCPVFGMSQAAMQMAAQTADRFAIVTLGAALGEAIQRNAESYGFAEQLTGVKILPWTVAQVSADPAAHVTAFADACKRTVAEEGIGAVIIGGGPLSGIADAIAQDLPVPILDGVRCAVQLAMHPDGAARP